MTCDDFNSLLDGGLKLASNPIALAKARQHAQECAQCAGKLEQILQLERDLSQLSPIQAEAQLLQTVMNRIDAAAAEKLAGRERMGLAAGVGGFILLAAAFLARYVGTISSIHVPTPLLRGLDFRWWVLCIGFIGAVLIVLWAASETTVEREPAAN